MTPHRAWAQIDLDALAHNVGVLKAAAPDSQLMAVVKADAYGHGLLPVARVARRAGAEWLGVALPEEALELRRGGDAGPLLCWLQIPGAQIAECLEAGIDVSAYDERMLDEVAATARARGVRARVHLKIDTGLTRGGAMPPWDAFFAAAVAAQASGEVEIAGIWSHLAYADEPDHPTVTQQITRFHEGVAQAEAVGLQPKVLHLANSAATLRLPETHFNLVRPGIALYGISPGPAVGTAEEFDLRPVMTLRSRLVTVKQVPAGAGISYGHTYTTDKPTSVGLVPLGYADGVPRAASNAGPVWVAGSRHTVAGRVCMDQFVVDLGQTEAQPGDEVVLFGNPESGHPTATDWAEVTDTIAYEIVTRVGPRVPRVATGGGV